MNNNIDRQLVKSQARQLIKNNVFTLFIIILVVGILTGQGLSSGIGFVFNIGARIPSLSDITDNSIINKYDDFFDHYDDYEDSFDDYDDFDEFFNREFGTGDSFEQYENPFDSFGGYSSDSKYDKMTGFMSGLSIAVLFIVLTFLAIYSIIMLLLSPIAVTMSGIFVGFVRRREGERFDLGEQLRNLFKLSFNQSFLKKLVLNILVSIITGLLSLLFIVPGIIFYYSAYFSHQIMCDNPNLKPSEAIKLSKKMVKGNRTELFVLELSFFWWYVLTGITCGIANIYVAPYIQTTRALYYENFRLRALADGRVTEDDFFSEDELRAKYMGYNQQQGNYYYAPDANNTQSNYYNPNVNNAQQNNYYNQGFNSNPSETYYNPQNYANQPQAEPESQPQPSDAPAQDNMYSNGADSEQNTYNNSDSNL